MNRLRRFMKRRAKYIRIFYDNTSNFVSVNNETKLFLNKHVIQISDNLLKKWYNRIFVYSRAPHFSGIW